MAVMNNEKKFTVASIEQWKSSLPLSNLTESTRAMYSLLTELKKSSLSPKHRFDVLCSLRLTVNYLTKNIDHFYTSQGILKENQKILSELSHGLYQELYDGFKTVLDAVKHSFFHPRIRLYSLQNAMHYCAEMLFHAYQYHRVPQSGLWLTFHHYFLFAKEQKLLHRTLPTVSSWKFQLKTIADIYKHCLLFSIANPYHLRHDQIDYLIYALEAWSPLLEIDETNLNNALYVVDCDTDLPPRYASKSSSEKIHLYYLSLQRVNQRLTKLITFRKQEALKEDHREFTGSEYKLPFAFLNNLLNAWQYTSERVKPREHLEETLNICLGIAPIHWHIVHPETLTRSDTLYPVYHVKTIDHSETGYCLEWSDALPNTLQSGEIIGIPRIISTTSVLHWEIGVIRWQRQNQSVLVGIQKICHAAYAIFAKPTGLKMTQSIPTLLLPKEGNKPITLITPLLPFKGGQEVEIVYNEKTYSATLSYLREQTSAYQEFELDFIEEPLNCPSADELKSHSLT